MNVLEVPADFLCPITQLLMEYPFITKAGNSYEYDAISQWLETKTRDPKSNLEMSDTTLAPNNSLRSQIQSWIALYPDQAAEFRNTKARKPPQEETPRCKTAAEEAALDRVLRVHKCFEVDKKPSNATEGKSLLMTERFATVTACGHAYTKRQAEGRKELQVRCDNGEWIDAPDRDMFVTPAGIMFYDRTDLLDAKVLPGTDLVDACKYGQSCTNPRCIYAHPFVCKFGVTCRNLPSNSCKFIHPSADSVVPVGATFPLNQQCRYNTSCSEANCMFAHRCGRKRVERQAARLYLTHSLNLEVLPTPVELPITYPAATTTFQCQGEFVLCFEPYSGPWASDHYKSVTVQRFDAKLCAYREVSTFALDHHYCNAAVAAGRYLVLSFWPYEEEAIRTVWECIRVGRTMEKSLKNSETEIKVLRNEVASLQQELKAKEDEVAALQTELQQSKAEIDHLKQVIAGKNTLIARKTSTIQRNAARHARVVSSLFSARNEAKEERRKANEAKREHRALQQRYERERNERLRLRDPIHVYALRGGASGFDRGDWALVLDYHKGAHQLSLSAPSAVGVPQKLEVVEHSTVVQFELCVPMNVVNIGAPLPLQPGRLCAEF